MSAHTPHTPGSWMVETCVDNRGARNGLYLIQTENRRRTLAKADRHYAGTYGETEANVRLMAAAPDMLKALRHSLDWLASYPGGNAQNAYDDVRAAIAKAEGR